MEENDSQALKPQPVDHLVKSLGMHLLIVAGALSLWGAADSWSNTSQLPLALALSVLNGLIAGYVISTVIHEWSHLAGAWVFNSNYSLVSGGLFVFDFDYPRNNKIQFLAMSIGGNLGGLALFLLLPHFIPIDDPGARMFHAGTLGAVVFAGLIEVPIISAVLKGADPFEQLSRINRENLYRSISISLAVAVLYWWLT